MNPLTIKQHKKIADISLVVSIIFVLGFDAYLIGTAGLNGFSLALILTSHVLIGMNIEMYRNRKFLNLISQITAVMKEYLDKIEKHAKEKI